MHGQTSFLTAINFLGAIRKTARPTLRPPTSRRFHTDQPPELNRPTFDRPDGLKGRVRFDGRPLEQLVRDIAAVEGGELRFESIKCENLFRRTRTAETRPFAVEALRGDRFRQIPPSTIESFAGATPKRPKAVIEGLVRGFCDHTYYDVPRYLAGSVEDNVLFGTVDLRKYFKTPTEYDAIESGETAGMFCYEFTWRSIEALHAVPAHQQRTPVMGAMVYDERHKHVYIGIASPFRDEDELVVPMTFVDYTHTTLYDDLHLRWLLGEGLAAYDRRHRATDIYWQP